MPRAWHCRGGGAGSWLSCPPIGRRSYKTARGPASILTRRLTRSSTRPTDQFADGSVEPAASVAREENVVSDQQPVPAEATAPGSAGQVLRGYADRAVDVAQQWAQQTSRGQTPAEQATTDQLAALLRDEEGLDLAVRFVDRVARPEDPKVAARDLSRLSTKTAKSFLGKLDLAMLGLGTVAAPLAPPLVVPLARARLRQIIGHLVVDARDPALAKHLAAAQRQGFQLNVNLLGEAVLGEREAASRTQRVIEMLSRDDVDYVSIKVSSLVSQISTWDTEGTVARCIERLRPLYQVARDKSPHGFVNLDMEEYRDLDLTVELFTRLLAEPQFHDLEAGIVLQAYLPDALPAMDKLIAWAQERRAQGGAGIKIRLVKGANLAMEQVEAALHGWELAPYHSKEEVDANYLRCIERGLRPDVVDAVRIGVASHNLYDVALAHLIAADRGVTHGLDVEMLQGMAPSQARAVKDAVGTVLLYTPVVAPQDFDVAVSYLIRRLEENGTKENFLHALFTQADHSAEAMADQERRFRASIEAVDGTGVGAQRSPARPAIGDVFANTPDSDPSLPQTRGWAAAALAATPAPLNSPVLDSIEAVNEVIARAREAGKGWAARPGRERAQVLRETARQLEARRGQFVTVMAAEGGKTVAEADPEISEAIDFARYYAESAIELEHGPMADGARFTPSAITLITPPWNFPVAIPLGGVFAALAAGSAVVIKPAHPTPGCVELGAEATWVALEAAGLPRDLLQVVRTGDRVVGRALVSHPDVETVILTGSSETATMFTSWRVDAPRGPRVYGETSGKNSLVITPAADLDLAVADLVRSAFGHAGQKCSAASLGILVGSVATSDKVRKQLVDAVSSVRVGWPDDLGTTMGPIIEPAEGKLLRALTTLEPGERWLVPPRPLDGEPPHRCRLWSPGLKEGVAPGSFFHHTEVFGPVLGLMTARTLAEALELQNGTAFGLTGGLHSLDEREIEYWLEHVEVGNAYVNRHITGAIVQRQPFGGWKASNVGPGAKAGGPNYVGQLGWWTAEGTPTRLAEPAPHVRQALKTLLPLLGTDLHERPERTWLRGAVGSDAYVWETELGRSIDVSDLRFEANVFRYRPVPVFWVRTEPDARIVELLRIVLAAQTTGTPLRISLDPQTSGALKASARQSAEVDAALRELAQHVAVSEPTGSFLARVERGEVAGRLRVLGDAPGLIRELASEEVTVYEGPVLATGRRELLPLLREQAISRTMHRFGQLPADAG
ncbi:MAG: bifunctional proline dehydrogenase/L-glutamate gamma-semialdehyde dehydrogenase [Austwickia sp.]|nr:bifunctional proline dehydrogenase/L-glutamate gamma-semialdehyde dehydrogenase [Austwickia sp.]MBK9102333.1 bifunctional proline dehydrogenase/L-glutamate gamma-semialdehyde dehydrogenase [Austwickia sp.]